MPPTPSAPTTPATILLAEAAAIAYQVTPTHAPTHLHAWAQRHGFPPPTQFDQANIQGFWLHHPPHHAILAFRGTSNAGQWWRDFAIQSQDHPWGKVHQGFQTGLAEVQDVLHAFAAAAQSAATEQIWLTGHSLGGALAVLAAAWLQERGLAPSTTTFGQPRVGDSNFAKTFNTRLPLRLHRFINQSDPVPRLPPLGLDYQHCGLPRRIVRPGVLESANPSHTEAPRLAETEYPPLEKREYEDFLAKLDSGEFDPNPGAPRLEGSAIGLKDHSMVEYLALLKEIYAGGDVG